MRTGLTRRGGFFMAALLLGAVASARAAVPTSSDNAALLAGFLTTIGGWKHRGTSIGSTSRWLGI